MPRWGFTEQQRERRPWGLYDALAPGKTITDPVHGDIYLTKLELAVIDAPVMQRLRRIKQLGMTHLIYPGATHTRFSHSLGALRAAQDLLDAAVNQRFGSDPVQDLFEEWEQDGSFDENLARATVLVRLGAVTHDLCHVPYGHSVEDELKYLQPHDKNVGRFRQLWRELIEALPDSEMQEALQGDLGTAIRPLILSKEHDDDASYAPSVAEHPYPFAADIVGNTICADLLDYLRRDHHYTGLPLALGRRFVEGFYVAQSDHPYHARHMVVRVARGGRIRHDVITELFKYLRYRYELSERALNHHAKVAGDAMVAKMLEIWRDKLFIQSAGKDVQVDPDKSELAEVEGMLSALSPTENRVKHHRGEALRSMERDFRKYGDEGLLERLVEPGKVRSGRTAIINDLAKRLLNRQLYKLAAYCSSARALSSTIHKTHGTPEARQRLERDACTFAGIKPAGQLVLWIPRPRMGLKAAEVLVDDGAMVAPLAEWDRTTGRRGQEIYDAHEALWAVSLYVHPNLRKQDALFKVEVAKAYLAHKLRIRWDDWEVADAGLDHISSAHELAIREIVGERKLGADNHRRLVQAVQKTCTEAAARTEGATPTWKRQLLDPCDQPFDKLRRSIERIWDVVERAEVP